MREEPGSPESLAGHGLEPWAQPRFKIGSAGPGQPHTPQQPLPAQSRCLYNPHPPASLPMQPFVPHNLTALTPSQHSQPLCPYNLSALTPSWPAQPLCLHNLCPHSLIPPTQSPQPSQGPTAATSRHPECPYLALWPPAAAQTWCQSQGGTWICDSPNPLQGSGEPSLEPPLRQGSPACGGRWVSEHWKGSCV